MLASVSCAYKPKQASNTHEHEYCPSCALEADVASCPLVTPSTPRWTAQCQHCNEETWVRAVRCPASLKRNIPIHYHSTCQSCRTSNNMSDRKICPSKARAGNIGMDKDYIWLQEELSSNCGNCDILMPASSIRNILKETPRRSRIREPELPKSRIDYNALPVDERVVRAESGQEVVHGVPSPVVHKDKCMIMSYEPNIYKVISTRKGV